jgi:hypothetical protein
VPCETVAQGGALMNSRSKNETTVTFENGGVGVRGAGKCLLCGERCLSH